MEPLIQTTGNIRKSPKQSRSRVTFDAILEATAQLLDEGNIDSISTNRIADRAGVSIGTLYQYFPNKTAVLVAVAERKRRAMGSEIVGALQQVDAGSLEETVRQTIRILITGLSRSHQERQLAVLTMILRLEQGDYGEPIWDVSEAFSAMLGHILGITGSQSDVAAFVITRSVMGTIRTALLDAPHLLREQEFEDQLVRLVLAFLQQSGN